LRDPDYSAKPDCDDVRGQKEDKEVMNYPDQWAVGRSPSFEDAEVQNKAAMLVEMACVMGREWRLSRMPGPNRTTVQSLQG
jgi:hypothetical protein